MSAEALLYFNMESEVYAAKIKKNPTAAAVKPADLKHNSDLSRPDAMDGKALDRAEKYGKAMRILTE